MTTNDRSATTASRIQAILDDAVNAGMTPGAVCRIARAGSADATVTAGNLAGSDGHGDRIPPADREPVREDTRYDLASVTKMFSAITVLSLAGDGVLELDAPIAQWLPEFRDGRKSRVTIAHLLSHTSGVPPTWPGWHTQVADEGTDHARWMPAERPVVLGRILGLESAHAPGEVLDYSCLGYITAMTVAERATGIGWQTLVSERVLTPLGLTETTFTPDAGRTAPTEYQPQFGRGMIRGFVHDETAYALGGISANAGLFSTIADLSAFGRAILAGLPGVLRPEVFERLWNDQLPATLGEKAAAAREESGFGQSLGMRIGSKTWMSASGSEGRGHNGFTGTSLFVDRGEGLVVALLANRVHPSREGADFTPVRAAVAAAAYDQH